MILKNKNLIIQIEDKIRTNMLLDIDKAIEGHPGAA